MQIPTTPATREGGQVRTSVIVVLKPRELTTVGKNYCMLEVIRLRWHMSDQTYLVEAGSAQMHVLHEHEQVKPRVAHRLHEACHCALARLQTHRITLDTVMSKLSLFRGEPLCIKRHIRQKPNSPNGDSERNNAFDDEQPLPPMNSMLARECREGRRSNKTRETDCEDVACVKDRHSCCDLFACVEEGQHVQSSRVEGRLNHTEEKSHDDQTSVVLDQCCERGNRGPSHHAAGHVDRRSKLSGGHEHVRRDLGEEISDVEDRYAGIVLRSHETQVPFEVVEACVRNGILIEFVPDIVRS